VKLIVLLVVMPVIAAGCFGGSSEHGASPMPPDAQSQPPIAATRLRIVYPLKSTLIRADLASCPADARCHDVQLPDCPAGGKCPVASMWVRVATRRLTCPLVYGDIHPTAACAALEDLMRLRKGRHLGLCSCAPMLTGFPQARAVGRYKGHRVSIPLDVCSLCGVGRFGRAAYRDAAILMPQP
jgi:hypothetical protein